MVLPLRIVEFKLDFGGRREDKSLISCPAVQVRTRISSSEGASKNKQATFSNMNSQKEKKKREKGAGRVGVERKARGKGLFDTRRLRNPITIR